MHFSLSMELTPVRQFLEALLQDSHSDFRRKNLILERQLFGTPWKKLFREEYKAFQKPKNDFPWGINKRGNVGLGSHIYIRRHLLEVIQELRFSVHDEPSPL